MIISESCRLCRNALIGITGYAHARQTSRHTALLSLGEMFGRDHDDNIDPLIAQQFAARGIYDPFAAWILGDNNAAGGTLYSVPTFHV